MMLVIETNKICLLSVDVKNAQAGLFDQAAYQSVDLYFPNEKLASAYAQAKYPGCQFATYMIPAIHEQGSDTYTLISKLRRIVIDAPFRWENAIYQVSDQFDRCATGYDTCVVGMAATPKNFKVSTKASFFSRKVNQVVFGFMFMPVDSMKDVTHLIYCGEVGTYLAKACDKVVQFVSDAEVKLVISDLQKKYKELKSYSNKSWDSLSQPERSDLSCRMGEISNKIRHIKEGMDQALRARVNHSFRA